MKITVFDVSNGNCSLAVCPNGHSILFDCGSHGDKLCPVDRIKSMRQSGGWLSNMKDYVTPTGYRYPLTQLVISHPDLDHIKNIEKVHTSLTPYYLDRNYIEHFPHRVVHQEDKNYLYYKNNVCGVYRTTVATAPDWGFISKSYRIPIETLKTNPIFGDSKFKNNSSIVYLLQNGLFRILFCGDMETVGWDWLIDNNYQGFKDELTKGVDVIVASHHGHTSGYSQKLMDLIDSPKLSILSKGIESGEDTNVDSRYSQKSSGLLVKSLADSTISKVKYTLTTRSNGTVYIHADKNGTIGVWAERI
jgi:hypothetical protein